MNFDISHIYNELNIIINNSKKYSLQVILHVTAALEIINNLSDVLSTNKNTIPPKFIKIMKYLREYVNCYIDFELMIYLCETQQTVNFCVNKEIITNKQFSKQFNIHEAIEDMLIKDNNLINAIIYSDHLNNKYKKIDKNVILLSKKLFKLLDKDNNGYLTALAILKLFKISNKRILLFDNDFFNIMADMLIINKQIDYYLFLKYLL